MKQLSGDLIRHKLPTYVFGQNVIHTEQTGSTNTELKRFARLGAPEGLLYITEEQLGGRGRQKKSWYAPPRSSLLMSLLFRPARFIDPRQGQQLTMLCALALADAITKEAGIKPQLKWPNDLIWKDGKKLAGILTELEIEADQIAWAVIGLGLNVNVNFASDETYRLGNGGPPLSKTATSLSTILAQDTDHLRLPILQRFLFNVERRYEALQGGHSPYQAWRNRLVGLGQPVTVIHINGDTQQGIMTDVDENGALLLQQENGAVTTIFAGDVSLRS